MSSYAIVVKAGDEEYTINGLNFEQATQVEAAVSMVASEVCAVWQESEQVWRVTAGEAPLEAVDIETLVKEEA